MYTLEGKRKKQRCLLKVGAKNSHTFCFVDFFFFLRVMAPLTFIFILKLVKNR